MSIENKKKLEKILDFCLGFLCYTSNNDNFVEYLFKYSFEIILIDLLKLDQLMNSKIWQIISSMASTNSDGLTQLLLEAGTTEHILQIIKKDIKEINPKLLKEIMFLNSNIAAGSISQVNNLIKNGIINRIIDINVELSNLDLFNKENMDYLKVKNKKYFILFIYFLLDIS